MRWCETCAGVSACKQHSFKSNKMKIFNNYINGEWTESTHHAININPSDISDTIGHYAQADETRTDQAIQAAAAAFYSWSHSGIQTRFNILDAAGAEILARKQELGTLLAREEGKTRAEGIGEVTRAGQIFKYFAGEVLRIKGDIAPSVRPGFEVQIIREPVGVIGIITPWNFPVAIPAWKIAPALAFGNTVVFKPARLVNGCAWALTDILHRAGTPAGVCTTSLRAATAFKRDSRAGMVMINLPTAGVDYHVPFGGIKRSSFGPREQGSYAKEFYTTVKTTYINSLQG